MANNFDPKYGEVTTEHGDFIDGEPVVVFRARDGLLDLLMGIYKELCQKAGSPTHHLALIEETRSKIADWQTSNVMLVKIPSSDGYMQRTGRSDI